MPNYTFTFKKDDIFVEFMTNDKEVIERQFQVWVADADAYAKGHPTAESKVKRSKPAKTEVEKSRTETVKEESHKKTEEKHAEQSKKSKKEVKEEVKKETFENAANLLKTINSIQSEEAEKEQPKESAAEESKQQPSVPDFEQILETSIESSSFEPAKIRDTQFLELINSKSTKDKFHYFIITAYYLLENEKLERFSLKQINAKLMQNLSIVVDHTVLQDAINAGFVEIVPDLTGISGISEYKLTEKGENFFLNEI